MNVYICKVNYFRDIRSETLWRPCLPSPELHLLYSIPIYLEPITINHMFKKEYLESRSSTINHFNEKLFLLKDRMNTKTAKKIAQERHHFMEKYLDRFFKERERKL